MPEEVEGGSESAGVGSAGSPVGDHKWRDPDSGIHYRPGCRRL